MGSTRLSTIWIDTSGDLDRCFVYDVVISTEPQGGATWASACTNPSLRPEALSSLPAQHVGWRPVSTKIAPAHLKLADPTSQLLARSAMLPAALALRQLELGLPDAGGPLWIASGELGARVRTREPGTAPVPSFDGDRSTDMLVAKTWTVARWALERGEERVRLLLPREDARKLCGLAPRTWQDVLAEHGYADGFVRSDADRVVLQLPGGTVCVEVLGVRDVQDAVELLHPSTRRGSRTALFGAFAVVALTASAVLLHDADPEPIEVVPVVEEVAPDVPPLEPAEPIAIVPLAEPDPPELTCAGCDALSAAAARDAYAAYPDAGDVTVSNLRVHLVDHDRLLFDRELHLQGCADGYRGVPGVFTAGIGFEPGALAENVRDLLSHCLEP